MRKYDQGDCQLISPFTPVIKLDDKNYSVTFFKHFYYTCSTDFSSKKAKCLNVSLKHLPSG